MSDDASQQLVARWRAGDESAADEIFGRYLSRLLALTRNRLSARLNRRVDAEDVVLSAYKTFFRHSRENRYVLQRSGDLWRLLVGITMKKLKQNIEFHTAGKRSFRAEDSMQLTGDGSVRINVEAVDRGPSPTEALELVGELDSILSSLDESSKAILEMRLAGLSIEQIADEINRSQRTVRRVLEKLRGNLERRLLDGETE